MSGIFACRGEAAMIRLGADLALALKAGDAIALIGDLGAGKTTLARAFIRGLAGDEDYEVPSPTFTIVQHYDLRISVAHYDLYRLGDESELDELGLDDTLAGGIALLEWPDLALDLLPETTLTLNITGTGEERIIHWSTPSAKMTTRIERNRLIRNFLDDAGYQDADRSFLTGDASARQYEIIQRHGQADCILMDAPAQPDGPPVRDGLPYSRIAHLAEDVTAFVGVAKILERQGFIAPEIFASHCAEGLLLISHLGTDTVLDNQGAPILERYQASAECLAAMHQKLWPDAIDFIDTQNDAHSHNIPIYDESAMLIEADLLLDWYLPNASKTIVTEALRAEYHGAWRAVFAHLANAEQSLVMRDFHSPNIIWRGAAKGTDRIGLIDFQDALIGPAAYDMASLAQDARVDMTPDHQHAIVQAYCAARRKKPDHDFDEENFRTAYAIMAAQRAAKILGIFIRLDKRDGKPHYLKHLPRMRRYFASAIAHDALAPIAAFCAAHGLDFSESGS